VRKRNGLTLEELSARCIQRDAEHAPSVSYLSMIEGGKRAPTIEVLELLAEVLQRRVGWFLDERADLEPIVPPVRRVGPPESLWNRDFFFRRVYCKPQFQSFFPRLERAVGNSRTS
jgi:transcriptional regulator with XRE-family HTH domain